VLQDFEYENKAFKIETAEWFVNVKIFFM